MRAGLVGLANMSSEDMDIGWAVVGGDHERKDLRRTASLFRRDGEFTLGSTATESAGVIKVVAFIPMGPRMEDAMYSSYGIPVTLVSTRPRSSKAIFEYVDLALGAKRGFRFLTAVIRSAGLAGEEKWGKPEIYQLPSKVCTHHRRSNEEGTRSCSEAASPAWWDQVILLKRRLVANPEVDH